MQSGQQSEPGLEGAADSAQLHRLWLPSSGSDDGDGGGVRRGLVTFTGLLLGLVTISHQKYLGGPMPSRTWTLFSTRGAARPSMMPPLHCLLLMTARRAASSMSMQLLSGCGGGYLDLFGQPAHTLVAADLDAQVRAVITTTTSGGHRPGLGLPATAQSQSATGFLCPGFCLCTLNGKYCGAMLHDKQGSPGLAGLCRASARAAASPA